MSTVLAADREFLVNLYFDDKGPAQEALRAARERDGHAYCACVRPPRRLVIREVRGTCYLALWPNDGHFHDCECPFHRDDAPSSARDTDAVRLTTDGYWDIALDSSQKESTDQNRRTGHNARTGDLPAKPRRGRLSFEQLLHWLWEAASLNRWGSSWKRDWWRVERELTSTAASALVSGESLTHLLYVPPPFRRDREAEIRAAWTKFSQRLAGPRQDGRPATVLLLGEIKTLESTPYGYRTALRHFASPIFIDAGVYATLAKQAPLALSLIARQKEMRCAVIVLFEVLQTPKGYLQARGGALMLASERFIQAHTVYELALSNALCESNRRFDRPAPGSDLCDFLLRDTVPATALEIFSLNTHDYLTRKLQREAASHARGCAIWRWETSVDKECPALPAVATERPALPSPSRS